VERCIREKIQWLASPSSEQASASQPSQFHQAQAATHVRGREFPVIQPGKRSLGCCCLRTPPAPS